MVGNGEINIDNEGFIARTPSEFLAFEILNYRDEYIKTKNKYMYYEILGSKDEKSKAKCLALSLTLFQLIKNSNDDDNNKKILMFLKSKDHEKAFTLIDKFLYNKELTKWDSKEKTGNRYNADEWNRRKGY